MNSNIVQFTKHARPKPDRRRETPQEIRKRLANQHLDGIENLDVLELALIILGQVALFDRKNRGTE